MKKKLLLTWIILLGLMITQAQVFTIVTGTVTDEATGEGVPGHEVYIEADSLYFSAVLTNESGFYTDTIVTNQVAQMVYIATLDLCTFQYQDTVVFSPPQGAVVVADFEICTDSIVGSDCQAAFYSFPDSLNAYLIQFVDQSTPAEAIDSWSWSFGDGTGSDQQNPMHEFGTDGIYPVCLTITTSPDNCSSTYCMDVVVGNNGGFECQANFDYQEDFATPGLVQFFDESTPFNQVTSWYWEFGENATSTVQNPTYTFGEPGIYPVCLTITAFDGVDSCISTLCQDVVVSGTIGCQAAFGYFQDSTNYSTFQFIDQSTPANQVTSWYWDFGDNTFSTEQNPSHTYAEPGIYPVCLTITAYSGMDSCISSYCEDVIAGQAPDCEASFSYVQDSLNPSVFQFFDQSTPAGLIYAWLWDFGDGTTSGEQNPTHLYNATGLFTVCLTISTAGGVVPCTSTFCMEVSIPGSSTYSLGGNTFADIYQLDEGFAYAYEMENGSYTDVYSQLIDTLGYYFFNSLAGDFFIKVEPTPNSVYHGGYLPTYYGDATHWEDAEMISLNQNIFTADINLVPMAATIGGIGTIGGHIFHGEYKDGSPASDVQVMLANAAGDYIGMVYSDEEGYFEFLGLPNGMYTLYAEVMGKSITPKNFSLTDENQHIEDVVMVIGASNIVFGMDEMNSHYVGHVNDPYPNPVAGSFHIDVEVKEPAILELNILNLTGQVVQRSFVSIDQSGRIQMQTESLSPGFYLLEIITEDHVKVSKRFVKQ